MLFEERLVWVMRADHPMADQPLTIDRLCALPHIIIAMAELTRRWWTDRWSITDLSGG